MYRSYLPTLDMRLEHPSMRVVGLNTVRDAYDWGRERCREYLGDRGVKDYESRQTDGKPIGLHIAVTNPEYHCIDQHIGVEESDDPELTEYTKAHEEGHAAHAQGYESQLERMVQGSGLGMKVKTTPFWRASEYEREKFAHKAGIYVLHRDGHDVKAFADRYLSKRSPDAMRDAFKEYFKAEKKAVAPAALRAPRLLEPGYAMGRPGAARYELLLRQAYQLIEQLVDALRQVYGRNYGRGSPYEFQPVGYTG